jgi:hypothetical protein
LVDYAALIYAGDAFFFDIAKSGKRADTALRGSDEIPELLDRGRPSRFRRTFYGLGGFQA